MADDEVNGAAGEGEEAPPEETPVQAPHLEVVMPEHHAQPPNFSSGPASKFPKEKLMVSEGIIPVQSGTNKYDSQKGMTGFGTSRDVLDHSKCTVLKELDEDQKHKCSEEQRLQCGTNKYASQKGMSGFGAVRDVNYHSMGTANLEEVPEDKVRLSDGIVRLQSGTNKLASQQGQSAFGAIRGVKPARFDNPEQDAESQGFIHLQMGTNRFASQKGMTAMGMNRTNLTTIVDNERPEIPNDESVLPRQTIGSSLGANQRGMTGFGAFRNTTILGLRNQERQGQGFVPYQMGVNWLDSQAGKTPFGHPRQVHTSFIDDNDTRTDLPEELARDPNTPKWTTGDIGCASQGGMTAIGMPRDVKGHYLRRLW